MAASTRSATSFYETGGEILHPFRRVKCQREEEGKDRGAGGSDETKDDSLKAAVRSISIRLGLSQ
ncbi:hypothetical protein HZ994_13465 [Akkermansiaceae bacterium]|nr:hypothetical protein HZ994_13465 [Akkermansiaceae bacterium]